MLDVRPPVTFSATSSGATILTVPSWATRIDLALLGAGSGGVTGVGNDSLGGRWRGFTIDLESWLQGRDVTDVKVELRVGRGGSASRGAVGGTKPGPGGDTTAAVYAETAEGRVEYAGPELRAPGGAVVTQGLRGRMKRRAPREGNVADGRFFEYNDAMYVGGFDAGGEGSDGAAHLRAYIPPQHLKINIYECTGTGSSLEMTRYKLGADRRYFRHTTVRGYPNNALLASSVPAGVTQVVAQITANPGRFCLIGTSQGAVIMSEVFTLLSTGAIPGRMDDCVGVFLLGNGFREAGRAFPGCDPIPDGHGIASASRRLTDTPELLWEFANPGDPICTVGDSPVEQAMTVIMEVLLGQTWPNLPIGISLRAVIRLLRGLKSYHNVYSSDDWRPSRADARSGVQIILDRLNGEIGPQHEFAYPLGATERMRDGSGP